MHDPLHAQIARQKPLPQPGDDDFPSLTDLYGVQFETPKPPSDDDADDAEWDEITWPEVALVGFLVLFCLGMAAAYTAWAIWGAK